MTGDGGETLSSWGCYRLLAQKCISLATLTSAAGVNPLLGRLDDSTGVTMSLSRRGWSLALVPLTAEPSGIFKRLSLSLIDAAVSACGGSRDLPGEVQSPSCAKVSPPVWLFEESPLLKGMKEVRFLSFFILSAGVAGGGAAFFRLPMTVPKRLLSPGFLGVSVASLLSVCCPVDGRDLSVVSLGGGGIGGALKMLAEPNLEMVFDAELRLLGADVCRGPADMRATKFLISSAVSTLSSAFKQSSAGLRFCSMFRFKRACG